jgi:hypothetical protein
MVSPGYPAEMPRFARGLAHVGARVLGLGDQPEASLPDGLRDHLAAYQRVPNLWDEQDVLRHVDHWARRVRFERVECLWEPGMFLAARIREHLGVPGLSVAQTVPFRDKELMKRALDRAGLRTPRHSRVTTAAGARDAASQIGFPLIVKPIAGAGATDTYRVDSPAELERALVRVRHVPELSVEEFVEGEEFTFDTICAGGRILYYNVSWYRPRPLDGKLHEWISPQAISLRDVSSPEIERGVELGEAVLRTLGFRDGFTHMEWYRTRDGEAVFGEIGARPPGARMVDLMNYGSDFDAYVGWAEAVCHGRLTQRYERRYNAAIVFKRAQGAGRIQRIEGLDRLKHELGSSIAEVNLLPPGSPRRDWLQHQISDGFVIVRHPDLSRTIEMADRIGRELQLFAG